MLGPMSDASSNRLDDRAVLRVTGADRTALFDRIFTNNTPRAGAAACAALLTPQGKVLFDCLMITLEDAILLDVHAAAADAFRKRLNLYKLRDDVTIEASDLRVASAPPGVALAGDVVIDDPRLTALGGRAYGPGIEGEAAAEHKARRRAHGVAEGADIPSGALFAAEANLDLLNGVDLKKGCFVGQEVVSRMARKSTIRRRLMMVEGVNLAPDAPVMKDGARVGEMVSADETGGFASIRLDRLASAPGRHEVTVGEAAASLVHPSWAPAYEDTPA